MDTKSGRTDVRGRLLMPDALLPAFDVLRPTLGCGDVLLFAGESRLAVRSSGSVAAVYQRMGLLPAKLPPNEYTPFDFSPERERPLPLLLGAPWCKPILVCQT